MSVPRISTADVPLKTDWRALARHYLVNRWVLLALGGGLIGIAAVFNWGWLVAAGVAPILISLAPCAIMCGLGLCGMKMMGACEKQSASPGDAKTAVASGALGVSDMNQHSTAGSSCCGAQAGETRSPQITETQAINQRSDSHA